MCSLVLSVGCHKSSPSASLDQGWSVPVTITQSKSGLGGKVILQKQSTTVFALQGQADNSAKCFVLNSTNNSWSEVPLTGVPRGYFWDWPAIDPANDRVCFKQDYMEDERLVMSVLVGRLTANGSLTMRDATEGKWLFDKKSLLGETSPNIKLTEPGSRIWPALGINFILNGSELYIPYSVGGIEITPRGNSHLADGSKGPFRNGILYSADSGKTWQLEKMPNFSGGDPSVCRSKDRCYCFAVREEKDEGAKLWFTSKAVAGGSWADLSVVTKTFGYRYITVPQNDTIHLCWLDRRHEKRRSNLVYPRRGNYEVAYCQRKDSDTNWSKDVILSEGLLYSFSPAMSVEGEKVVVAWSGIQKAGDWHAPSNPNDIYCRTSKDGGKTWGQLLKVTDGVKDGITSGDPQVVLQNGIIHLTYIQGKLNFTQESPGLTKLNQPPWPILYQQRPFPN